MLKITHIRRYGLNSDVVWDEKKKIYYCRGRYFGWVHRINFIRDGLHYSIQLSEGEGYDSERSIEVRCKEDKTFYMHLGYGTPAMMELLFDWDWRTKGTTYQTFPTDKLEAAIFGGK